MSSDRLRIPEFYKLSVEERVRIVHAFALNILVIHALGDVISPVIIGIVSDRYSMTHAFTLVGVMFVVAGILWLCGIKFLKRDTELAPTRLGSPEIA